MTTCLLLCRRKKSPIYFLLTFLICLAGCTLSWILAPYNQSLLGCLRSWYWDDKAMWWQNIRRPCQRDKMPYIRTPKYDRNDGSWSCNVWWRPFYPRNEPGQRRIPNTICTAAIQTMTFIGRLFKCLSTYYVSFATRTTWYKKLLLLLDFLMALLRQTPLWARRFWGAFT